MTTDNLPWLSVLRNKIQLSEEVTWLLPVKAAPDVLSSLMQLLSHASDSLTLQEKQEW